MVHMHRDPWCFAQGQAHRTETPNAIFLSHLARGEGAAETELRDEPLNLEFLVGKRQWHLHQNVKLLEKMEKTDFLGNVYYIPEDLGSSCKNPCKIGNKASKG